MDGREKAYTRFKEAYPQAEYTPEEFNGFLSDSAQVEKIHAKLNDHYEMPPLEEFKKSLEAQQAGTTAPSVAPASEATAIKETVVDPNENSAINALKKPAPAMTQLTQREYKSPLLSELQDRNVAGTPNEKRTVPTPHSIEKALAAISSTDQDSQQEYGARQEIIAMAQKQQAEEQFLSKYPKEVQDIVKREGKMPTSIHLDEDGKTYKVVFGKSDNPDDVQIQSPEVVIKGKIKPIESKEQLTEVQKLLNSVSAQRAATAHFENAPPGISTPSNESEIKSQNFYDWISESTGKEIKSLSDVKKELGKETLTDADLESASKKYVITSPNFNDAGRVTGTMPTADKLNTHPIGRLATSFVSGGVAVAEGTLGAIEWAGSKSAGTYADKLKVWNEAITAKNQNFIEQVAGGLGSQIVFIPFGIGVGTMAQVIGKFSPKIALYFAAGGSSFLEASTEAGLVYRTLKQDGKSDQEASTGATYTFLANIPLDFITDKIGVFGEHKVGKVLGEAGPLVGTATAEGVQESGQQIISNIETNRPTGEGVAMSGAVGALTGGMTQAVMSNHSSTDESPTADISQQTKDLPLLQGKESQELKPTPSVPTVSQETKAEGESTSALGVGKKGVVRTDVPSSAPVRVIAPNGEEATLIGESKTSASIKYDDGVVEQHPIDEIQRVPSAAQDAMNIGSGGEGIKSRMEIPKEISGEKIKELSEPLSDGTEVFETEGGRFVTRDGKEVLKKPEPTTVSPQEKIVQPEASNEATGKPFEQEKAYRVQTESLSNKGGTAKEIVDFEADELGNEEVRTDAERVAKEHGIDLSKVPAEDIVWVTRKAEDAASLYAYDSKGNVPGKAFEEHSPKEQKHLLSQVEEVDTKNTIVLHDLGADGVLLLKVKSQKEPWQMTKAENQGYVKQNNKSYKRIPKDKTSQSNASEYIDQSHKGEVEQALSEGKPVPAEVLKDYPELTRQVEKPKSEQIEGTTPEQHTAIYDAAQKQAKKMMAKESYPWKQKDTDQWIKDVPKLVKSMQDAIERKDYRPLVEMTDPNLNPFWKKTFTILTGIELPKQAKANEEAIRKFIGEEKYNEYVTRVENEKKTREEARLNRERDQALSKQYKSNGKTVTAKELIDNAVSEGYTRYEEKKEGFKTVGVLANEKGNGYRLENKYEREYAQQKIQEQTKQPEVSEKPTDEAMTPVKPSPVKEKLSNIDKEIDDLWNDFDKTAGEKLSTGIDPVLLGKGMVLITKYTEKGVYKFADIVNDLYAKYGPRVKELLNALKQAYMSFASTASDDIADQLTDLKEVRNFNLTVFTAEPTLPSEEKPKGDTDATSNTQTGTDIRQTPEVESGEQGTNNLGGVSEGNATGSDREPSGPGSKPLPGTSGEGNTGAGGKGEGTVRTPSRSGKPGATVKGESGGKYTGLSNGASEEQNHVIENDNEVGNPSIRTNIQAIDLLRRLEKETRNATPDEKKILATYTGWGGFASIFDEEKAKEYEEQNSPDYRWSKDTSVMNWGKTYAKNHAKLRELLSNEEWNAAKESTLNAHYTAPDIIRGIWEIARHLGFKGGNVLEPGMGIGHFFGLAPKDLSDNSQFIGVEIDAISGKIAKYLYPKADIQITGIESAKFGKFASTKNPFIAFADMIVTNAPFAKDGAYFPENNPESYGSFNPNINKHSLHNQFIIRGLDALKPGGIYIGITTSFTMDANRTDSRTEMSKRADLVGAIRLPYNAFKKNAKTEVTTDILIFRKKDGNPAPQINLFKDVRFLRQAKNAEGALVDLYVNEYFEENQKMMLGEMGLSKETLESGEVTDEGGLYSGNQQVLKPKGDETISDGIERARHNLPSDIFGTKGEATNLKNIVEAEKESKDYSFQIHEGEVKQVVNGKLDPPNFLYKLDDDGNPVKENGKPAKSREEAVLRKDYKSRLEKAKSFVLVRDAAKELMDLELSNDSSDEEVEKARKTLNRLYNQHVNKNGYFNSRTHTFLDDDPEFALALSLEKEVMKKEKQDGKIVVTVDYEKSDKLSKRTQFPYKEPEEAESLDDAIIMSMLYKGYIKPSYISSLLKQAEEGIVNQLEASPKIFLDPETMNYLPAEQYLSGYVRKKLTLAKQMAEKNPYFNRHVEELKKVVPIDISPQDIQFQAGANWIPADYYKKFALETFGVEAEFNYSDGTANWLVKTIKGMSDSRNMLTHAAQNVKTGAVASGFKIFDDVMHSRATKVTYEVSDGEGGKKTIMDEVATAVAKKKQEEIATLFHTYVLSDPERAKNVQDTYNSRFNGVVPEKLFVPTWTTYPGAVENILMRDTQRRVVARSLVRPTGVFHFAGGGKTFAAATTCMEARRLRTATKPMIVVQNSTIEQFSREFKRLYPHAKLLVSGSRSINALYRKKFVLKCASGDYDAIIIPKSFFNMIEDDPQRVIAFIREQLDTIQDAIWEAAAEEKLKDSSISEAIKNALEDGKKGVRGLSPKVKDLVRKLKQTAKKLKRQMDRRVDNSTTFERLGVDFLIVDEAHDYKKLGFVTNRTKIKGIDSQDNQISMGLRLKSLHVMDKTGGKNFVMMTGTPITNTLAEAWTMLRYLNPSLLSDAKIDTFDQFVDTFGDISDEAEYNMVGDWEIVSRFRGLKNAPEFVRMFQTIADVVLDEDVHLENMPEMQDGKPEQMTLKQTPALKRHIGFLRARLHWFKGLKGEEKAMRPHIPITVFTEAKKGAIDMRLVNPLEHDFAGSKTNQCAKQVLDMYKNPQEKYYGKNMSAVQLVFCDLHKSKEVFQQGQRVKWRVPEISKKNIDVFENGADFDNEDLNKAAKQQEVNVPDFTEGQAAGKIKYITKTGVLDVVFDDTVLTESGKMVEKKFAKIIPDGGSEEITIPVNDSKLAVEDPKESKIFDLYQEIKKKLIEGGMKPEEIIIIDDQKGEKREKIFEDAKAGVIRVLIGHSEKLGIGVNVQDRLIAIHHLDAPTMPYLLEQRTKRMVRFGNLFGHPDHKRPVHNYFYGVEKSLDATAFESLTIKQRLTDQTLKGNVSTRIVEDSAGSFQMSLQDMQGDLTGNPLVKKKTNLEREISDLQVEKANIDMTVKEARTKIRESVEDILPRAKRDLDETVSTDKLLSEIFPNRTISTIEIDGVTLNDIPTSEELAAITKDGKIDEKKREKLVEEKGKKLRESLDAHIKKLLVTNIETIKDDFPLDDLGSSLGYTRSHLKDAGTIKINGVKIKLKSHSLYDVLKSTVVVFIPENWKESITTNERAHHRYVFHQKPTGFGASGFEVSWETQLSTKELKYDEMSGNVTSSKGFISQLHHQLEAFNNRIEKEKDYIKVTEGNIERYKKDMEKKFPKQARLDEATADLAKTEDVLQNTHDNRPVWMETWKKYLSDITELTPEEEASEKLYYDNSLRNAVESEKPNSEGEPQGKYFSNAIADKAVTPKEVKELLKQIDLESEMPNIVKNAEELATSRLSEEYSRYREAIDGRLNSLAKIVNSYPDLSNTELESMLQTEMNSDSNMKHYAVKVYLTQNGFGRRGEANALSLFKEIVKKYYNGELDNPTVSFGEGDIELMRLPYGMKPSDIIKQREATGNQKYGVSIAETYKIIDEVKKGLEARQVDTKNFKVETHPESWRSEEEVSLADDMSVGVNGKKVTWFSGPNINGFYSPETDSVWINVRATNPATQVYNHELGHYLDINHPDLYDAPFKLFVDEIDSQPALFKFYEEKYGKKAFKEAMDNAAKNGRKGILGEAFNDLISERMADEGFWKKMYADNPGNTRNLIDRIREFIKNLKGKVNYQVARFLRNKERVLDAIDDMLIAFDKKMQQKDPIPNFTDSTEAMLWGRRHPEMLSQLEELLKKKEFAISMAKRNHGNTSIEASRAIFARQLVNEAITYAKNPTKKTIAEEMGLVAPAFMPKEIRQQWYYSQMERVLERDLPNAGMPDIYSKTIEAYVNAGKFKKEELEWSGIQDWLKKQTGKVTKQQVLDYLAQNNVQVKEVVKGGGDYRTNPEYESLLQKIRKEEYDVVEDYEDNMHVVVDPNGKTLSTEDAEELPAPLSNYVLRIQEMIGDTGEGTKFSQYVLPGGENYRELLLTLPPKNREGLSADEIARREAGTSRRLDEPKQFRSSHFDEPNVLAHVRFNDRTSNTYTPEQVEDIGKRIAKGLYPKENVKLSSLGSGAPMAAVEKGIITPLEAAQYSHAKGFRADQTGATLRTLFIEELQSDWHQKGRKEGYTDTSIEAKDRLIEIAKRRDEIKKELEKGQHYNENEWQKLTEEKNKLEGRVPNAPFKTTWQEMAFRRMVRYAAENGYDKIAWTTGEQQNARYDLSKQVDIIRSVKNPDGTYNIRALKDGKTLVSKNTLIERDVEQYVGKELAQKIITGEEMDAKTGISEFSGLDLKVGGEGMKGFYDQILPSVANKLGKKFGAKVEDTSVRSESNKSGSKPGVQQDPVTGMWEIWENGNVLKRFPKNEKKQANQYLDDIQNNINVHSLPITEEMRSSALYDGLPLFQRMDVNPDEAATDEFYSNIRKETLFNSPETREEFKEKAIRRLQDYLRPLLQLQRQKEVETGKVIPDSMNAWEKETLMYRQVQERFEELHNDLFQPLYKAIAVAKKAGAGLDDVRKYMMALHAPERNAYIRTKRTGEMAYAEQQLQKPNLSPKKRKKFEDKIAFLNSGSGMTDARAVEIVQEMQKRGLTESLDDVSRIFKAITKFDLDNRLEYGLISEEMHKELTEQYKHYMPLRGFADGLEDETIAKTGRGFSIRGKEWKSAGGRRSESGDILAYALFQAEEGIIRGEKNKVQRAFYDFVLEYPDLAQYEIERWYFVRQVDKLTGQPLTSEEGKAVYKAQSARPSKDEYTSGRVKFGGIDEETEIIVDFDRTRIMNDKKVVGLKVDGKQVYIKIKDENLAKGLMKLGIVKTGAIINATRKVLQAQRQFITTLSPTFGIGNFERDLQEALLNLNAKFDSNTVLSIAADVPSAMNGLIQHRRKNYKGQYAQTAKDYFRSGGGTGFIESKDVDTRTRELIKTFKEAGKSNTWIFTKNATKAILGAVEAGNDVIENGIRLATYKHLIEKKGWSKQKALVFSKELTVNFNRKGEVGNVMNATYLFFNTQIQGTTRLLQNFSSEDPRRRKRAYAQAAILAISSLILGNLFRLLGGKDDDDQYFYDKESDWTRQHNMLIPLPGEKNFFPIKVPYGYNVFWGIGDCALRAGTTGNIGGSALTMMSTAMDAFNPMGSNESKTIYGKIGKTLSPTILDPIVDLALNEDFMANRIRPEDPFNQSKPNSEKYFKNIDPKIKAVTDAMNKMTGGDRTIAGAVSISPEDVEYIIQFYSGGTGKFVMNTLRTIGDLAIEGKTELRNVPMASVVLHRTPSERYDQQKFRENIDEVRGRIAEINNLADEKDNRRAIEIVKQYQPILKLKRDVSSAESGIKRLNRVEKNLTTKAGIDELEKQKSIIYKSFNTKYKRAIDMIR